MNVVEFYAELRNTVSSRATLDNQYLSEAYLSEVADRLVEAEESSDITPVHFVGTGIRGRNIAVSGFAFDDTDGSVALMVVDHRDNDELRTINSTEVARAFGTLRAFLEESLSGAFQRDREESAPEWQLAEDLRERGGSVSRYRLCLLTNATTTDRLKNQVAEPVGQVPVELRIWDVSRLCGVWESRQGREELIVDLTEWLPDGLPVLQATARSGGDFTTFLACVPGDVLADLYAKYGSRLLESNVRSFLTARGKVNRGIRSTVASEPEMFLAFNNGITATATSVCVNQEGMLTEISDLQIVNGGQTTASLFYLRREQGRAGQGLAKVDVQMKLVVVDADEAQRLVPQISRFANSQNRVSEADFFSNSPFHVRLEELSRRILAPLADGFNYQTKWFYERTRGQYQNEVTRRTDSDGKKYQAMFPKSQIITKTEAARYVSCWDEKPHLVSAGAQRNFTAFAETVQGAWDRSPDRFNEEYFRELVGKAILYSSIRQRVSRADWYAQGYLANITAYTMSWIAHEVRVSHIGRTFDFGAIWSHQGVNESLTSLAETVAVQVLEALTTESRRLRNVTEWAKSEECWVSVRESSWPSGADLGPHLVAAESVLDRRREAVTTQRLDVGIAAQLRVVEMGQAVWGEVREFGDSERLLSPTDRRILDVASGRKGRTVPSEKQATRLLQILERCTEAGFRTSV